VDVLQTLLEGEQTVGIAPIILQEILQGADSESRFEKWRTYFLELECYVSSNPVATHVAAARLYQQCRRAGRTPRSSNDCLIAEIAIEAHVLLLHNDRDFDSMAAVEPALQIYQVRRTSR
jgi:predicted nucleic acid-binding protein